MMHPAYHLHDAGEIPSPALVVHKPLIAANIAAAVKIAHGPGYLRPHVKTHKTAEITAMQLAAGVTKHKCATIAEAEMLAAAGVPDVLISYPLVGPNVRRLVKLKAMFPAMQFSSLVDCKDHADQLSAAGVPMEFVLDLDVGMHRTGIAAGPPAVELYRYATSLPNLIPGGLQAYDGHNNTAPRPEREAALEAFVKSVWDTRSQILAAGLACPRTICGGTPSFPVWSRVPDSHGLEFSPGTYVLHDHGYGSKFPDLTGVVPAAVLLTRVVSRPTANRVTLDLGNKAVAADPPLDRRVKLLDFPDYTVVTHNEEHLVVETAGAARYRPGDVVYALPGHVCPTVALYRSVLVAENNRVVDEWRVTARDRVLTI